jgi:peptide deformylase
MILPILTDDHTDSPLRQRAQEVVAFDDTLRALIANLADTLYASRNGIGLAANQVGVLQRVLVIDLAPDASRRGLQVFINPVIRKATGRRQQVEGCLSLPGKQTQPWRAAKIEVAAVDPHGRPFKLRTEGLMAACLQHEMDHLDGILMTVREQLPLV